MSSNAQNEFSQSQSKDVDQKRVPLAVAWVPSQSFISSTQNVKQQEYVLATVSNSFTKHVVELINSALESVIIVSFLLADKNVEDAIDKAAVRGVRVYLLLASETHLDKDNSDDEFSQQCEQQHRAMLKQLGGKVMVRSSPHFHAKVVLVDAIGPLTNFGKQLESDQEFGKGMLLTANLTSEALERNEELAVPLTSVEIDEMTSLLKWAFFEAAEHQMLDNSNFLPAENPQIVPFPGDLTHVLSTSEQDHSIKENALRLIEQAQEELMVSSYGWDEDHEVIEALCGKARNGVRVVVFSRIRSVTMPALLKLVEAGATVYGFKWLHAKAIWADTNEAMVMSANLDEHGLESSFEVGLALTHDRARAVKDALELFLKKRHWELRIGLSLGDVIGDIKVWEGNKLDKDFVTVQEQKEIQLDDVSSNCLTKMDLTAQFPNQPWRDVPAHTIKYHWNVTAPVLDRGATEIFMIEKKNQVDGDGKDKVVETKHPYSPRVFKSKKAGHQIAISNPDEMDAALRVKNDHFHKARIVVMQKSAR